MGSKLLIIVLVIAFIIGLTYFSAGFVLYRRFANVQGSCDRHLTNRPDNYENLSGWPHWPESNLNAYLMPNYLDVHFPSRQDGLSIAGWYVEAGPSAPVIIIVDGLGGCRYAQAALLPAGMLWNSGFNVLIIDLRDTGDSDLEYGYSTFGNKEYLDALGAWDWLISKKGFPASKIGMYGNSMGAATVLYAFEQEPQLAAVFLNSPFADLSQIIKEELRRNRFPSILAPAAVLTGWLVTRDNIIAHNPVDALRSSGKRPVFIVHSKDDELIGIHHSQKLETVAKRNHLNLTVWYIEGAGHVQAPAFYPDEFQDRITQFFRKAIDTSP